MAGPGLALGRPIPPSHLPPGRLAESLPVFLRFSEFIYSPGPWLPDTHFHSTVAPNGSGSNDLQDVYLHDNDNLILVVGSVCLSLLFSTLKI